jgi:hypothetical protein
MIRDKLRRRIFRCMRRIGIRRCCCHNIVAGSNFVLLVSFCGTKHLDSGYCNEESKCLDEKGVVYLYICI